MEKIILENVFFKYGKTLVLENVNFSIDRGEVAIFFGPNGGGKTTLFKIILGLLKAEGKISLFGKSPKEIREKISYIPQTISFERNFPIDAEKMVLLGALEKNEFFFSKEMKKKARDLLKLVGLDQIKAPLNTLSKGQIQRALIARALIADPEILILDEPTSNIDYVTDAKIFDLILGLKGKKTILMVTHDLKKATLLDKVFIVDKQVMVKTKEELCEHFSIGLFHRPLKKEKK